MQKHKNENHLYEKDFYKWAMTQADLIKHGKFEKVDLENVIEEIECLGRSERNVLKSQIERLLMHMLKIKYQPSKHIKSWDKSIYQSRIKIEKNIKDNPSLKRELEKLMNESFVYARKNASIETGLDLSIFPMLCPWSLKEVLGE